MFFTEIKALSACHNPDVGNTLSRHLPQAIEDMDLRKAFSKGFFAMMNARKLKVLTRDELSVISIQYCDKLPHNIEASKRLLSMGILLSIISYEHLMTWIPRAVDHCPGVVEYIESTLSPWPSPKYP